MLAGPHPAPLREPGAHSQRGQVLPTVGLLWEVGQAEKWACLVVSGAEEVGYGWLRTVLVPRRWLPKNLSSVKALSGTKEQRITRRRWGGHVNNRNSGS